MADGSLTTTLPFGEWRPDIAHLNTEFASEAKNVFAGANSYLPFGNLIAQSAFSLASGGNDSNTKVLLHFNGADGGTSILDENVGGSAHTWTAAGNANTDDAQFKFGPTSLACDGTGDWVTTSDHADFSLGSSDFTISCWVRPAADGSVLYIAGQNNSTQTAATTSFFIRRNASNFIAAALSDGVSATLYTGATTQVLAGSWWYIQFVRSGTAVTLRINGATEQTGTFSGAVNNSANDLRVGASGELTSNPWNGWIDEFELSVGAARAATTPTVPFFEGGACRGLFIGRTSAGVDVVFAGTRKKLFIWNSVWNDISRITGVNYNLAATDYWSFAQSGTKVVAVNVNDSPQVMDIDAGTQFTALGGSPPQAVNVTQVGDFLVLSSLSTNRRKIRWSAINDITGWTVGTNLCDEQEFPDGGLVIGIAGLEVGPVLQERSIRSMQFLPGDTDRIFAFSRVEREKGGVSRYGFVATRDTMFFIAEDGFYSFGAGGLTPIGAFKINNWFRDNSDLARRNEVLAFVVPEKQRVVWAFYNTSGSTSFDRLLIYDWSLGRWTYAVISAQMWVGVPFASQGVSMGAVDTSGFFSLAGNASFLAALIETAEIELVPGMRSFVNNARPIVDVATATVTAGTRERQADSVSYGSAVAMETNGDCPVLSSSRLHRFRLTTLAGTSWTHAQGVEVDVQPDGEA